MTLADVLAMTPTQCLMMRKGLSDLIAEEAGKPSHEADARIKAAQAASMEARIKKARSKGQTSIGLDKLIGQSYGGK